MALADLQRIRHRAQFDAVLSKPPATKTMHFALHLLPNDPSGAFHDVFPVGDRWLGAMVPKRWAKRAATRNLIRRHIYESGRMALDGLPTGALVVRLRSGYSREQFPSAQSLALKRALRQELQQLLAGVRRA
jgi:ribonuclease P protein component